jgi:hypothetical protein
MVTQKLCPNSCSGKGNCVAYDSRGGLVSVCAYNDASCSVVCNCDSNSVGKDCAKSKASLSEEQSFRMSVCNTLRLSMSRQENTSESVGSRILSLANTLRDVSIVDKATLFICTGVLVDSVLNNAGFICGNTQLANTVSLAFSNVLAVFSNPFIADQMDTTAKSSLLNNVTAAIEVFSSGCEAERAIGELPQQLITSNFRLKSISGDSDSLTNFSLSTALSSFEESENINPGTVFLGINSLPPSLVMGLSLVHIETKQSTVKINATVLSFSTSVQDQTFVSSTLESLGISTHQRKRRRQLQSALGPEYYDITVPNSVILSYPSLLGEVFTRKCNQTRSASYQLQHQCPDGSIHNFLCPPKRKGILHISCPGFKTVPKCVVFSDPAQNFVIDPLCEAISFSSVNTTCRCRSSATMRRLQSGLSTYSQYSSIQVVVREELTVRFIEGVPVQQPKPSSVVFSSLLAIMSIIICGCSALFVFSSYHDNDGKNKKTYSNDRIEYSRSVKSFFDSIFPFPSSSTPWRSVLLDACYDDFTIFGLLISKPMNDHSSVLVHHVLTLILSSAKGLTFVFASTMVFYTFSADDGFCQNIYYQNSCEAEKTFFHWKQACYWHPINESCQYNQIGWNDYRLVIVVVQAILLGSIPYHRFLTWSYEGLRTNFFDIIHFLNQNMSARKVMAITDHYAKSVEEEVGKFDGPNDEFERLQEMQSWKSKFVRFARFWKLKYDFDPQLDAQEASFVHKVASKKVKGQRKKDIDINARYLAVEYDLPYTLSKYEVQLPSLTKSGILYRIRDARSSALQLLKVAMYLRNSHDVERLLMFHVLADQVPWLFRSTWIALAKKSNLLHMVLSPHAMGLLGPLVRWSVIVFQLIHVVSHFVILGYFSFSFGFTLGTLALNCFVIVTLGATIESVVIMDVFRVLCVKVWTLHFVVLPWYETFWLNMQQRSKIVMLRTFGLMRRSQSFVQHFNGACRAARQYPESVIARMINSLLDRDLGTEVSKTLFRTTMSILMSPPLLLSKVLPWLWVEMMYDIFVLFAMTCFIAGVVFAVERAAWIVLIVVGSLIVVILAREMVLLFYLPLFEVYYMSKSDGAVELNILDMDVADITKIHDDPNVSVKFASTATEIPPQKVLAIIEEEEEKEDAVRPDQPPRDIGSANTYQQGATIDDELEVTPPPAMDRQDSMDMKLLSKALYSNHQERRNSNLIKLAPITLIKSPSMTGKYDPLPLPSSGPTLLPSEQPQPPQQRKTGIRLRSSDQHPSSPFKTDRQRRRALRYYRMQQFDDTKANDDHAQPAILDFSPQIGRKLLVGPGSYVNHSRTSQQHQRDLMDEKGIPLFTTLNYEDEYAIKTSTHDTDKKKTRMAVKTPMTVTNLHTYTTKKGKKKARAEQAEELSEGSTPRETMSKKAEGKPHRSEQVVINVGSINVNNIGEHAGPFR